MLLIMKNNFKFVRILLIGICCSGFLNSVIAATQKDIQERWCDGVTVNTYVRNVSDCRVWVRCRGSDPPLSGTCPDPGYFSVKRQRCTLESEADCFVCDNSTSISYAVVEGSCNRFIRCIDGVPSEMMCGIGMGFNPDTGRCEGGFYLTCVLNRETTTTPSTSTINGTSTTVDSSTSTVAVSPTATVSAEAPDPDLPTTDIQTTITTTSQASFSTHFITTSTAAVSPTTTVSAEAPDPDLPTTDIQTTITTTSQASFSTHFITTRTDAVSPTTTVSAEAPDPDLPTTDIQTTITTTSQVSFGTHFVTTISTPSTIKTSTISYDITEF